MFDSLLSHLSAVHNFTPSFSKIHFNNIQLSGIVLGYVLEDWVFESRQGLGISLFSTQSRPALGPTQPPIQWVPGDPSLGVKRSGREANHTLPSSAEVNNAWSYTSTPTIRLHGVLLSYRKITGTTLPLPYLTFHLGSSHLEVFQRKFSRNILRFSSVPPGKC
jgi:hypothetical protein